MTFTYIIFCIIVLITAAVTANIDRKFHPSLRKLFLLLTWIEILIAYTLLV